MKRILVYFNEKGIISVGEEKVPETGENEILVEVHASLISPGTEIGGIKHLRENPASSPWEKPFGYGNAGIVVECGKNCTNFTKGMKVACMGSQARHTNYAVVPQNLCISVPDNVSFEEASFAHLAATSLNAVRRANLEFGENVLAAGLGIVGNIAGQLSHLSGCHVIGTDLFQLRRNFASQANFDKVVDPKEGDLKETCEKLTRGDGIDCAFICFGGEATDAFKQILDVMKTSPDTHKMGRVVIPGGCQIKTSFGAAIGNLDIRSAARTGPGYYDPDYETGKDYPPVFVPWTTRRNLEETIRAVSEKKLLLKHLITHTFPISQAPEACELLISQPQKTLGVILKPLENKERT